MIKSENSSAHEVVINTDDVPSTSNPKLMSHSQGLAAHRRKLVSQQSSMAIRKQQAVCVRGAFKMYGSTKKACAVLDGLNMTVPKGSMCVSTSLFPKRCLLLALESD